MCMICTVARLQSNEIVVGKKNREWGRNRGVFYRSNMRKRKTQKRAE